MVEDRLEQLERRLRRRTFVELAAFVLFAAVVGVGFASVDYSVDAMGADLIALHEGMTTGIKSQQFLLLDQQGEVRGYTGVTRTVRALSWHVAWLRPA
jgi:hypothetical protein